MLNAANNKPKRVVRSLTAYPDPAPPACMEPACHRWWQLKTPLQVQKPRTTTCPSRYYDMPFKTVWSTAVPMAGHLGRCCCKDQWLCCTAAATSVTLKTKWRTKSDGSWCFLQHVLDLILCAKLQGRLALVVLHIDVCASLQQLLYLWCIILAACHEQQHVYRVQARV